MILIVPGVQSSAGIQETGEMVVAGRILLVTDSDVDVGEAIVDSDRHRRA